MEMLTTKELAEFLKVDPATIWRWRKKGLPFLKFGGSVRFEKEKVIEWVKNGGRMV